MKKIYAILALFLAGTIILVLPGQIAAWRNTRSYPVTLDNSNNDCRYPASYNIQNIDYVTWQQWDGSNWNIYFSWGYDTNWAPANPYQVTNNGIWGNNNDDNTRPDICAHWEGGDEQWQSVYIAWQYWDQTYSCWEIQTCRIIIDYSGGGLGVISSINYGKASDNDYSNSILPAIDCNRNVFLAWEDYRNGTAEIYFDFSRDGFTWNYDTFWSEIYGTINQQANSSDLDEDSKDPCIAVEDVGGFNPNFEQVCVLWEEYDSGVPQIWQHTIFWGPAGNYSTYSQSCCQVNNGMTQNSELDPDIEDFDDEFLYVWADNRDGNWEIYEGKTWFNAAAIPVNWFTLRVTNDIDDDEHPTIDIGINNTGGQPTNEIQISWNTDRTGNGDIYACRGIQNIGAADTLFCSGQGLFDSRVTFTNNLDDYSDISTYNGIGYCVWEQSAAPWAILYTRDP
jgi:hypothetical protein